MNAAREALIEEHPPRTGQYVLVAILLLAIILEGVDIQLLSLLAPLLLAQWHADKAALGAALSAALIGMGIGAVAGGWLGDHYGRKRVIVCSVLCFGIATAGVSVTTAMNQLTVLRLIGGLGFGAIAPNAMALLSERLSGTLRVSAISLLSIGTPLGGVLGTAVLVGELMNLGWRGSFALFGVASMLVALIIQASVRRSPGSRETPVDPGMPPAGEPAATWKAFFDLGVSARCFTGTSLCAIGTSYAAYASIGWFPVLLTGHGLTMARSLGAMLWFNLCALCSSIVTAYLVRRLGSRRLMQLACGGAGAGIVLLCVLLERGSGAAATPSAAPLGIATGLTGWGTGTLLTSLYLVIALRYPASSKSTGLGVAMLVGRLGAIAASWFGGALLAAAVGTPYAFYVLLMAGMAIAAFGANLVDRPVAANAVSYQAANSSKGMSHEK